MSRRFGRLLGLVDQAPPAYTQYDPVYGLPLRAIDEWLARNPRFRKRSPTKLMASKPVDKVAPRLDTTHARKVGYSVNQFHWHGRQRSSPETAGRPTPEHPEEALVADARAGLTPSDMIEHRLQLLLRGAPMAGSQAQRGGARVRGCTRSGVSAGEFSSAWRRIPKEPVMRVVQPGDKIQVHYVKRFQGGSIVSSRGKAPTELIVGVAHPRLPGLELTLVGLAAGESRTLSVPAEQAYGPFNPRLVRRLARRRFAEHKDLSVGQWVRVWDRQHRRRLVRVVEIGEITVVVDANRRWAGQSLELEVVVLAIHEPEVPSGADKGTEASTLDAEGGLRENRWREDGGR